MTERTSIDRFLERILSGEEVYASDWPTTTNLTPEELGLLQSSSGRLFWPDSLDVLDLPSLYQSLPELDITHFRVIDSTNTRLVSLGVTDTVANQLYVAEFQYGGKGRRGRQWLSPYARNVALSMGIGTARTIAELGGLSLVVGLGLADLFESLGIEGVELKWPNDILVNGCKLSGILVELVQRKSITEVVVGIGVNVEINATDAGMIDQAATDLRRLGVTQSRTELVIRLVQRVGAHLRLFEEQGFAPFVNAFNDLHAYHAQTCTIVQGSAAITGTVAGIGEQGELILHTDQGEQRFHGGEVSLRPRTV